MDKIPYIFNRELLKAISKDMSENLSHHTIGEIAEEGEGSTLLRSGHVDGFLAAIDIEAC